MPPTYTVQGATFNNVGGALSAVDTSLTAISNDINGDGIKYFHANSTLADSQALGTDSVAIGPTAVANNAGDVALGSGSTTAAATGTTGTTINGTAYTFAGTAPASTVSVGSVGAERTITNVAAGRISATSTDAINGSELYATGEAINSVAGQLTHYYSVNDGGTQQANYSNNGATGTNSFAAGVAASATAASAVALGDTASATVSGGVALGSNSVSDRALAPTSGTIGGTIIPYNTTDKTLLGAISVGNATAYRQITNVGDGTQSSDAVTVRQLTGALSSFATTTTQYFHANSTLPDLLAVGK